MTSSLAKELERFHLKQEEIEISLREALKNGGTLSELFFEDVSSTQVLLENGAVDRVMDGVDCGVGLRLVAQNHTYYGYTTKLNGKSLLELAQTVSQAVLNNKNLQTHKKISWQPSKQNNTEILNYAIHTSPREWSIEQKVKILQRADTTVWKELKETTHVTCVWGDLQRKILVINSDGVFAPCEKTYLQVYVQVVGKKDDRVESAHQIKGGFIGVEFFEATPPEAMGKEAARRVGVLLKSKPAPSGTMPVVLSSEAGGTMIHEAVGHGLEADLACNGLSVYQNKLGQSVASPLVTVIDDGTIPKFRGSFSYDDEAWPSQKNILIENGILKSYMVDRLSAFKFDLMATGNGRRESFRHKPIVRMTNTYIAPGTDDPIKILENTKWGIFVKAMGGGQVNTVTGDFVFAVIEAYLIRDGKLGEPIRGATLVGNGPKVLSMIDRVGSDLEFVVGTCGKDGQGAPVTSGQPTLRITELTVGGEVPIQEYWKL
ncbi:MAG: TldD/PmbA family protein [Deltaproteobacteria bacterium]|nr:TldD/PmbA family protein [Deltaproteobacteria bacterium]